MTHDVRAGKDEANDAKNSDEQKDLAAQRLTSPYLSSLLPFSLFLCRRVLQNITLTSQPLLYKTANTDLVGLELISGGGLATPLFDDVTVSHGQRTHIWGGGRETMIAEKAGPTRDSALPDGLL